MKAETLIVGSICIVAAAVAVGTPRAAAADGFVEPVGSIWVKAGYRSWFADREFAGPNDRNRSDSVELGDPIPFDSTVGGGEIQARSFELQLFVVPLERLEVGLFMPVWQQLRFSNANFRTVTTGTGDVRAQVGYQITPPDLPAATTVSTHLKIPTTQLEVDVRDVPLSEGQVDLAFQQATSWAPIPRLRLTGTTMFRYRFPGRFPGRTDTYKPGNEMVASLDVGGGPVDWLWLQGGVYALWSTGWELREGGGASRSEFRAFQEVRGTVYWQWGELIGGSEGALSGFAVDASVAWPFAGRDYPRGLNWAVALAWGGRVALPW